MAGQSTATARGVITLLPPNIAPPQLTTQCQYFTMFSWMKVTASRAGNKHMCVCVCMFGAAPVRQSGRWAVRSHRPSGDVASALPPPAASPHTFHLIKLNIAV